MINSINLIIVILHLEFITFNYSNTNSFKN